MRVVISGGGIAGLTLAAKLRQQGREPIVLERASEYGDVGYGIGLWPLGSSVFHGLGVHEELVDRSVIPEVYEFGDHTGRILQRIPMSSVGLEGDPIMSIARHDMIEVLRAACGEVDLRMGTTITSVEQDGTVVELSLSTGETLETDLLVITEGLHSNTREQVFGPIETLDTHWAFWTWWGKPGRIPQTVMREYWGPGRTFAAFPCGDRIMVGAGFPVDSMGSPDASHDEIKEHIREANIDLCQGDETVSDLIDDATEFFLWPMIDVRSRQWSSGRVVLCGDAGTGFLPTAGVGASNALRSAAGLADELSRTGAKGVPLALELFEKRSRKIIEANQKDSRSLAHMMFIENRALNWARDQMLRHYPPTKMVDDILDSMKTPF